MEFYSNNKVIFLTGATGFIGKTILEKILRSLPQVEKYELSLLESRTTLCDQAESKDPFSICVKIYLLMRVSSDQTLEGRVCDIFDCRIFETLKAQFANEQDFRDRVVSKAVPVRGDLALENLGMSAEDRKMVQSDTTVLISNAASVSWTDPLRTAMQMNCHGPLKLFKLAQEMPRLSAVVHVSTAFVNTHLRGQVNEEIYPCLLGDAESLFERLENMSEEELTTYERDVVLKTYPNTYVMAKSLTEHLIKARFQALNLPIVIVRPSSVGASISEPVPGWVEGTGAFNGPMMLIALGAIQDWIGDEKAVVDVVPVDMVCKTILMAATQASRSVTTIPVFQAGTSSHNPVIMGQLAGQIEQYWQQVTLSSIPRLSNDIRIDLYYPVDFEIRIKQRFAEELKVIQGEDNKGLRKKLDRENRVPRIIGLYVTGDWSFGASNAIAIDDIAPTELYSDLGDGFNWTKYLHHYNMGVHEFLLKDDIDKKQVVRYNLKSYQKRITSSGDSGIVERDSGVLSRL
ncbi:cyclin-dependent kinase inhibitor far1 [Mortierella sp. AD094]|nr:cyclin-dependent kinase inhibitor far1 [Mortierella sp. AD094]